MINSRLKLGAVLLLMGLLHGCGDLPTVEEGELQPPAETVAEQEAAKAAAEAEAAALRAAAEQQAIDEQLAAEAQRAAEQARVEAETAAAIAANPFRGRPVAEILNDSASPVFQRVFYFGYDSSELSQADREALARHAEFLTIHPEVTVVVEGHADERGSREYNLALGEKRAQMVERLLALQGVGREQQQVISFGEERPVAPGHDEQSWHLNRRVELLYSGY